MLITKNFWFKKKVLITGHNGFKGSWLCLMLFYLGARVYGYSLKETKENFLFSKAKIKYLIEENIVGDIRNYEKLNSYIKKIKPQIIFHLASQALVIRSYKEPFYTFDVNFRGTLSLLNILKKKNFVKSCVIVTSDKVYDINNKRKNSIFTEKDSLGGVDPYSASKACKEILVNSYNISFFRNLSCNISTARSGNVLGGGDRSSYRVVPDFFRALEKKKKLFIRSPNSIRPWQYVLDALMGYLLLAEKIYYNKNIKFNTFNFGPNKKDFKNVKFIINFLKKKFDVKVKILKKMSYKETDILKISNFKSRKYLGWRPLLNLKETLNSLVFWEKNLKKNNIQSLSLLEVKKYFEIYKNK